jgi:hypothetical protein
MTYLYGDLELIKYVEDPSTAWFCPRYYSYIVSATLFLATVCQSLCLHQVRFRCYLGTAEKGSDRRSSTCCGDSTAI